MATKIPAFEDLMSIAERNAKKGEKKAQQKVYPVTSKPKKLDPKEKKLSEGIKKFLEQKKNEDKQKQLEAQAKRQHLEELRSQTKGANRRVGQMLRMTKSANKACMADAQSCINDSLAAQGEYQPDEDDYGYVSQSAQQWHQKMMASYKNIPANTITRKPAAPIPEARSLKESSRGVSSRENSKTVAPPTRHEEYVPESKPERTPAKRKLPPPPNYNDLINLAKEKSKEPLPIKKPVAQKHDGPEFEYGRPMTAKEKAAYQQEKTYRERIEKGLCTISSSESNKSPSIPESTTKTSSFKIPSKKAKTATQNTPPPPPKGSSSNLPTNKKQESSPGAQVKMPKQIEHVQQKDSRQRSDLVPTQSMKERPPIAGSKPDSRASANGNSRDYAYGKTSKDSEQPKYETKIRREQDSSMYESKQRKQQDFQDGTKVKKESESSLYGAKGKRESDSSTYDPKRKRESSYYENPTNYPEGTHGRKDFKTPAAKSSSERMEHSNGGTRSNFEPKYAPAVRPKMQPTRDPQRERRPPPYHPDSRHPPQRRPPPPKSLHKGRAVIDSDDEYDSEMDDFIDDSEVDMQTVSNEISQIFNYRRDKYIDEDSDDECMESSLEQQMREERRSLLIGIQEDKEEEMKEKAEEARKRQRMLAAKKSMSRRGR